MLNRSFKPAKCKTALKLAGSRIKLLKNKKEAQVKQMKRELANLLQSGQDRTAMIRVEHVVMEEKKLSAYDLIEIYCELIVVRLPVIESQKNCPIDLKEAITSVVFASPKCADVPELVDVRKHFTAKYGKDFVSAAVEMRPDCGVARMMIEKLSAKAPDGPAKIKILKSIAEEHNINWDPSAESDPKPPEDLLNGASSFGKGGQMYTDPPNVQVGPSHDHEGQSAFQVPSSPANSYDNNRSVYYSQNSVPRETVSGTSHPEARHPGSEFRHSYSGRQKWNVEFKDAAEAAQAAAECADRASMAARAAAHLSTQGEHLARNTSHWSEQDNLAGGVNQRFYNHGVGKSSSLKSRPTFFDYNPVVNRTYTYPERNSYGPGKSGPAGGVSNTYSPSHERAPRNDNEVVMDPNNDARENPCAVINEGRLHSDSKQTSSNDKVSSVFDESGSDDDEDKEHEPILFFSSPSPDVSASRSADMLPVTIYDSDGPSSESEEDVDRFGRMESSKSSTRYEEKFGFSDFPSKLDESQAQLSKPRLEVKDKFHVSELPRTTESSLERGSGLNLGMLTGGLRNKGMRQPPYTKNHLSGNAEQSSSPPRVKTSLSFGYSRKTISKANGKSSSMPSHAHSDHDKSWCRSPTTYFDSDRSDSEVNLSSTTKARSGTVRTRASPGTLKASVFAQPDSRVPSESLPKVQLPRSRASLDTLGWSATESPYKEKPQPSNSSPIGSRRTSSMDSPSKEKPSHVHPKLPDIDSFTAHFHALRSNRRST